MGRETKERRGFPDTCVLSQILLGVLELSRPPVLAIVMFKWLL